MLVTIATVSTEEFFGGYITTHSTIAKLAAVTYSQSSALDESGSEVRHIVNTRVPTRAPGENLFLREILKVAYTLQPIKLCRLQ